MTKPWMRRFILIFGLFENLIFTGTILGWSALNYMLKNEGVYEHLCTHSQPSPSPSPSLGNIESDVLVPKSQLLHMVPFSSDEGSGARIGGCGRQDAMLNLAYTIGSFAMGFSAFIWGFLLDRWGLRTVRNIINTLITAGTVMLCFTSRDRSFLVFPAVILMSLAGVPLRIANMQLANYYPTRRSTVITFYSGAFSASAVIFVLLKALYDGGMSFPATTAILVVLSVAMFPFTYLALPEHKVEDEKSESPRADSAAASRSDPQRKPSETNSREILFRGKPAGRNSLVETFAHINPVTLEKYSDLGSPAPIRRIAGTNYTLNTLELARPASSFSGTVSSVATTRDAGPLKMPLRASLTSPPYLLHQFWYSWLLTYMIMYVGSMNLWLDRTTDDLNKASHMVKVYGIVQILALVLAPAAGLFMDWSVERADREKDPFERKIKRAASGFWPLMITTLSLMVILFCRFFDSTAAIYSSIVFITLLRSFLIAVASAFLRIRFPADHFNRLLGIMSTVGSCFTLLQFPLFVWESQSATNAFYVNLFNCGCTVLALLNPLHLIVGPLQRHFIGREEAQLKRSDSSKYSTGSHSSRGHIILAADAIPSRMVRVEKNLPTISTIANASLYNIHNKNVSTLTPPSL